MNLEETKEFFSKDKYAIAQTGLEIVDKKDNYSKIKMEIQDFHKNAVGYVMGGAYYTLADFAFAVATNDFEHTTVTTTSQISYFKPMTGKTLFAEARLLKDGRVNCFYQIDLRDEENNLIAQVNTCGTHILKKNN